MEEVTENMKRVLLVSTLIIILLMTGGFVSGNTNVSGNETGAGVETVLPHGAGATVQSPLLERDPALFCLAKPPIVELYSTRSAMQRSFDTTVSAVSAPDKFQWSVPATVGMHQPHGIGIDSITGNIYVVEYGNTHLMVCL
jgi:hypothetical protein